MTNRKKMALAGLLVLVMVASAVMGTLAYLTDSQSLGNTFLVGVFTPPDKPKPDPDNPSPDPDNPDPTPNDDQKGQPNGFIYEPFWNANGSTDYTGKDDHRLLAGDTTVKDPYIGIGPKSESGYVLVCITNPMKDHVGFTLSKGWVPVTGYATEFAKTTANGLDGKAETYYSEGLFAWVGTTGEGPSETTSTATETDGTIKLAALTPTAPSESNPAGADAWTTHPVFTNVYTGKDGLEDLHKIKEEAGRTMTVHAYIHQTNGFADESATSKTDATSKTVIDAAKTWATNDCGYTAPTPGAGA